MSGRRAPRTPEQRQAQWTRSIIPGALGGSVANASPVPSSNTQVPPSANSQSTFPFSYAGTIKVVAGTHRLYNDTGRTLTIRTVRASLGTAPTGADVIIDVNKNGTTIFTTQSARPTVAATTNTGVGVPAVVAWPAGQYLTIDIDQIGSTVAGADLTVAVVGY